MAIKRALIRADGSKVLGLGHVLRCLAIAERLVVAGWEVSFGLEARSGHPAELLLARGFDVHFLPVGSSEFDDLIFDSWMGHVPADLLIIDHPELDSEWHFKASKKVSRVLIVDDIAGRDSWGDWLLNPSPGFQRDDYASRVSPFCKLLIGPSYALVRAEFLEHRLLSPMTRPIQKILISFGGADSKNQTEKVLNALSKIVRGQKLDVDIILGGANCNVERIQRLAEEFVCPVDLQFDVTDMARRMANADLIIGAAGGSAFERCCLGVPSIMIMTDETQRAMAAFLNDVGAGINLGWFSSVSEENISDAVLSLLRNADKIHEMGKKAWGLVDGKGADRVLVEIERIEVQSSTSSCAFKRDF